MTRDAAHPAGQLKGGGRPLFAVYGASGCGRGVLPIARSHLTARHGGDGYDLVFVDDAPGPATVNGHPLLTYQEFLRAGAPSKAVAIAISNPSVRGKVAQRCAVDGLEFFPVIAGGTVLMDDVELGEGAVISPFVTLTSNIRVGRFFHCNLYSYVEHDCVIGDFVTFAPAVRCNGNVRIEDFAYLGSGCILRQGIPGEPLVIGRGAVVGMGAVVTRSVAPGTTVVGCPARAVQKK